MSLSSQLEDLATCLCAEVGGDTMCYCGVIVGDDIYDLSGVGGDCEDACGQAWVRVTDSFMASTLGVQDVDGGNCGLEMNVVVEVGVLRCLRIPEKGEANTAEEMVAAFEQQQSDMLAIRRALLCCDSIDSQDVILGTFAPIGPQGGLYGGVWTAIIGGF